MKIIVLFLYMWTKDRSICHENSALEHPCPGSWGELIKNMFD